MSLLLDLMMHVLNIDAEVSLTSIALREDFGQT